MPFVKASQTSVSIKPPHFSVIYTAFLLYNQVQFKDNAWISKISHL